MSPKVARKDEYDETCDVYSLALVMWQVMALKTPYEKYDVKRMFQLVYDCPHVRPSLAEWQKSQQTATDEAPPTQQLTDDLEWFAQLLEKMWNPLVEERPSMRQVYSAVKKKLDKYDRAVSSSLDSGPEK
jgi:serine/threonine protein kinase